MDVDGILCKKKAKHRKEEEKYIHCYSGPACSKLQYNVGASMMYGNAEMDVTLCVCVFLSGGAPFH